jgi:hypothetical protein
VIKELYATVLERNTAAGSSTTGKSHAPLELDLRTPTRMTPPVASPAARAGQDHTHEADQRAIDERFTELPTEVGLDLDLNTSAAPAPELTDLLAPGNTGRAPARTEAPAAATVASAAPADPSAAAARAHEASMPAADFGRPDAGGRRDLSDDQLTQTPTEVSIDIDVGTATDFASTISRSGPRSKPSMDPIDLQLDLSQPLTRSKRRSA